MIYKDGSIETSKIWQWRYLDEMHKQYAEKDNFNLKKELLEFGRYRYKN